MTEQIEWFANTMGNIIGTIAGKTDKGWSYAVLKGDGGATFESAIWEVTPSASRQYALGFC